MANVTTAIRIRGQSRMDIFILDSKFFQLEKCLELQHYFFCKICVWYKKFESYYIVANFVHDFFFVYQWFIQKLTYAESLKITRVQTYVTCESFMCVYFDNKIVRYPSKGAHIRFSFKFSLYFVNLFARKFVSHWIESYEIFISHIVQHSVSEATVFPCPQRDAK